MNHNIPRSLHHRLAAALTGLGLFLAVCSTGQATNYNLDTSAFLAPGSNGFLAFDLLDGDGVVNNTLTITNLTSDGIIADVSNVTVTDAGGFFNEELRAIQFGTMLSFDFQFTGFVTANPLASPDMFGFYLLGLDDSDPNNPVYYTLFPTSDPLGTDALIALDANGTLGVYAGSVPDTGSTLAFIGLALALLMLARKYRSRRFTA
ncbi:MAG TPA: VPDSG-CTERM sorting domain-containing protein [Lacunisphaera sp.]|nr:VPDSG-CTERM sorting domain-containing protein [Lacunisphaera sp.]